jgi:divalent metal cation (Fe/Co/Zn/Cd) transporter
VDLLLIALDALVLIALLMALVRALVRWHGVSRLVAILVALALVSHVIKVVIDLQRDPTSHNLWPFEVLEVGGAALVVLGVVAFARARSTRRN